MASFASLSSLIASKSDANLKAAAAKAKVAPLNLQLSARKLLQGHYNKIAGIAWGSDGSLFSAAQDGKIVHWNAASESKLGAATLPCDYVMAIDCSQDEAPLIAVGGMDNVISLYHASALKRTDIPLSSRPFISFHDHSGYISSLSFCSQHTLFSTSGDSCARLWDLQQQVSTATLKGDTGHGMSCGAPQPASASTFVTCEVDGHIQMWDTRQPAAAVIVFPVQQASSPAAAAAAAAAAADVNAISFLSSAAFVTAHDDGFCRIWDMRSSCAVGQLQREPSSCGAATALCVSSSGRVAFVGYTDGTVKAWDVLLEEVSATLAKSPRDKSGADHSAAGSSITRSRISCLKLSPDGFAVASSSWDKNIRIFA